MSYIDLDFISADSLMRQLANDTLKPSELADIIIDLINDQISEDRARALGYIDKYDNPYDLVEGHDVRPLKAELSNVNANIAVINRLLKGSHESE